MSNSLIDDLEEEFHSDLLENGNLRGKAKNEWSDDNSWQSLGYAARVNRFHCSCGVTTNVLTGVFHVEVTPKGTRHEQRLDDRLQVPLEDPWPVYVSIHPTRHCAACLSSKGFTPPESWTLG